MRLFGEIHTVDYIPTVQYLPGKQTARNKIAQNREDMFEFYREVIDEHKRTFDPDNIRDLIDTYLAEIEKAQIEGRELFDGRNHGKFFLSIIRFKYLPFSKFFILLAENSNETFLYIYRSVLFVDSLKI